jgi:maltose alpha-D-glucosyltransferase / alpha-amylase
LYPALRGTGNAGFSAAPNEELIVPVNPAGRFGARRVNVRAQQRDPDSLLRWFQQLIRGGAGMPGDRHRRLPGGRRPGSAVGVDPPLRLPQGSVLLLHNLADVPVTVDVGKDQAGPDRPWEVFADSAYPDPPGR